MRYEGRLGRSKDESVSLTPFILRLYITSMFCKSVAAFVVAVWLALLGVKLLGRYRIYPAPWI